MNFSSRIAVLLAALLAAPASAAAKLKFASQAPEGTDALKVMKEIDRELSEKTGGALGLKLYPGGRQGDEKDMVRKIRAGQLHGGGFTGVGLGEIAPEIRVLDAPWLFRDAAEVDFVHENFAKDFEKTFAEKGYILLGWTEVGFVHVFSNRPVRSAEDLRKLKIWVWEGDPIAEAAFAAVGVHPTPLAITDVNTSLQTGLIDSVYTAPLYAIALQWHEKTKFIFSLPLANATGAVLLSKKAFDELPADHRALLLEVAGRRLKTLNALTRRDNEKALETLKKQGLTITDPASEAARTAFAEAGRKARRRLVGRLYSKELLDKFEKALEGFRASRAAQKK